MSLSPNEEERMREEELFRWEVQNEMKRKRTPRLALIAVLWIATLTALAYAFHLH